MEQKELLTVIVADDETELREAVCSVIPWKEIGFRLVGSAGNGLDALQLVEQLQPDLLLTDIRMPYISGVSLAQQVRELRPLTQIAFLSGYDDFAYAQKAIEYNVISYLLKPISMRELTEALAEIRGKIRRKFARLLPQKPEKSGWRELLLPLLLDGFAEEAQQDDPALLASLVGAGILAAGQERYSLTVLAIRLEQDGKNRTTPDMAYTVDMLLGKLCRSRSVYSGGRLLTLLIAEEEPRGLELAIDELRQSFARVLELRAWASVTRLRAFAAATRPAARQWTPSALRARAASITFRRSRRRAERRRRTSAPCWRRWTICCAPAAVRSWKSSSCRASAHRAAQRRATA